MRHFQFIIFILITAFSYGQSSIKIQLIDQYERAVDLAEIEYGNQKMKTDEKGFIFLEVNGNDSTIQVKKNGFEPIICQLSSIKNNQLTINKDFSFTDLLTPMFYIKYGGVWLLLLIIFAETGLFIGFFLPGDSLLFVAGIYNKELVQGAFGFELGLPILNLLFLCLLITAAAILGNMFGYWFGRKSGPFLFERKDTFLFKKKYLFQARDFYDKHGGRAIVIARFIPIVRTFAPIIAGVVGMNRAKFTYFNIIGSIAWVVSMTFGGHYLQTFILDQFQFDLKQHLEVIVLGIVFVSTTPVLIKIFSKKKTKPSNE